MPSTLLETAEERMPRAYSKDPSDVFVLIKAYVSDNDLRQPPLLVMPGCRMPDVTSALSQLANTTAPCILH